MATRKTKTGAEERKHRPSRSQAERSEATQLELIAATIRVIEDRGLDKASSFEIAKAAGLTPGAIQHHFESKKALLLRAASALVNADDSSGHLSVWSVPGGPLDKRAADAVTTAWQLMYSQPRYLTMWSVFLACRTDAELREHFALERESLRRRMLAGFMATFPELAGDRDGETVANMVFSTLRGMGLNQLFLPSSKSDSLQLSALADFVRIRCEGAIAAGQPKPPRRAARN